MAWALCPRCGFRVPHSSLKKEWAGSIICTIRCWDPRPPWLDPPYIDPREGTPFKDARFEEPADPGTFISDNDTVEDIDPIDPANYPRSY